MGVIQQNWTGPKDLEGSPETQKQLFPYDARLRLLRFLRGGFKNLFKGFENNINDTLTIIAVVMYERNMLTFDQK